MNTILTSDNLEPLLLVSLLSSAAFVSHSMTYLTFMKDINEESRQAKLFYGFLPLSGKKLIAVKASMYLLSFCQLLGKAIEMAVLMQIGGKTLAFSMLSCEMGVYLLYKVVMNDFRYW